MLTCYLFKRVNMPTVKELRQSNYYLAQDTYLRKIKHKLRKSSDLAEKVQALMKGFSLDTTIYRPNKNEVSAKDLRLSTCIALATFVAQYALLAVTIYRNPTPFLVLTDKWERIAYACATMVSYRVVNMFDPKTQKEPSLIKKIKDGCTMNAAFKNPYLPFINAVEGQIVLAAVFYLLDRYRWIHFTTPVVFLGYTTIGSLAGELALPIIRSLGAQIAPHLF